MDRFFYFLFQELLWVALRDNPASIVHLLDLALSLDCQNILTVVELLLFFVLTIVTIARQLRAKLNGSQGILASLEHVVEVPVLHDAAVLEQLSAEYIATTPSFLIDLIDKEGYCFLLACQALFQQLHPCLIVLNLFCLLVEPRVKTQNLIAGLLIL